MTIALMIYNFLTKHLSFEFFHIWFSLCFVQCTCNSHVHPWSSRDQRNLMNVNQISLSGIRRFPWHSLAVDDPLILQSKLLLLVPTHLPLYNVNRQKQCKQTEKVIRFNVFRIHDLYNHVTMPDFYHLFICYVSEELFF